MLPDALHDFPKLALPNVQEHKSFYVSLIPKDLTDFRQLGKNRRLALVAEAIWPLLSGSNSAYLYAGEDAYPDSGPVVPHSALASGRFKVPCGSELFREEAAPFWIDWNWNRGTLIWKLNEPVSELGRVLRHTFNPIAIENPESYLQPDALERLRGRTLTRSESSWVAFPSGVQRLFVYANSTTITKLFELALAECQFTSDFVECYGAV